MSKLDLEQQLRFYGAYHHNHVNILIHITCVPVLLWTAFILCTNTPNLIPLPSQYIVEYLPPNLALFVCLLYGFLYILMEPVAGGVVAVLLLGSTAAANYLTQAYGMTATYWAIGAHITSWLAQFVGHGAFEGRAPALLDNLFQAFFLAPLFVWLEILFAWGYRPELKKKLDIWAEQDVAKFREGRQKSKVSAGSTTGSADSSNGHTMKG